MWSVGFNARLVLGPLMVERPQHVCIPRRVIKGSECIYNYDTLSQGCKFSDFCLISENFTSKYLKMFFEISSL